MRIRSFFVRSNFEPTAREIGLIIRILFVSNSIFLRISGHLSNFFKIKQPLLLAVCGVVNSGLKETKQNLQKIRQKRTWQIVRLIAPVASLKGFVWPNIETGNCS